MIPLSLYIHIPWCVKKCPYCDFNSHGLKGALPVDEYIDALLLDFDADRADFAEALENRAVQTVFFGGGTPSLFPPDAIARILDGAAARIPFARDAEVTLEANPGTIEHGRFDGYLKAGVNRVSFGVQSFDDRALKRLGRIHGADEARDAVKQAQDAGLANLNLDLMYALPLQDLDAAAHDIDEALALNPAHVSHYQLTLEPNTLFAAQPPPLPDDDLAWDMQEHCQGLLAAAGYAQYEVSAYAREDRRCAHNLNYWTFGDYLGIGAGAHGKITARDGTVRRRAKKKLPRSYLGVAADAPSRIASDETIPRERVPFEFMLNALRLNDGFALADFERRTALPRASIDATLGEAAVRGWLDVGATHVVPTELGRRLLNDVIELFLP